MNGLHQRTFDRVDLESHFLGKPVKLGDNLQARRVGSAALISEISPDAG